MGKLLFAVAIVLAFATQPAAAQDRTEAVPTSRITPTYPPAALEAGMTGVVTVAAHVAADGSVTGVEVLDCTHRRVGFEAAATEALAAWRFEPARADGRAVDSVVAYQLVFDTLQAFDAPGGSDPAEAGQIRSTPGFGRSNMRLGSGASRGSGTGYSTASLGGRPAFQTPSFPPLGAGHGMYDRRQVLPAPRRGGASRR